MSNAKHTQTPWYAACWTNHAPRTVLVDDTSTLTGKRIVADCDRDEDAAFIVRAVNSHEQLVDACKMLLGCMHLAGWENDLAAIKAREAIAAAEG